MIKICYTPLQDNHYEAPMKDWQQALAPFEQTIDFQNPVYFDNLSAQMQALGTTYMLVELSHLAVIQISGADCQSFLQGQLTCDVNELKENCFALGAYCNLKGRVLSTFYIVKSQNNYYLFLPKSMLEKVLKVLSKYAAFSQVEVTDASDEFLLTGLFIKNLDDDKNLLGHCAHFKETHPADFELDNIWQRVICLVAKNNIQSFWNTISKTLTLASHPAWQYLDVMAKIPMIELATTKEYTPHALNLPSLGAVSFTKGCYRGQEIVARMEYLGKSKQQLLRANCKADAAPQPGDEIFIDSNGDEKACGHVINVADNENNNYQLLIVINSRSTSDNNLFLVKANNKVRLHLQK